VASRRPSRRMPSRVMPACRTSPLPRATSLDAAEPAARPLIELVREYQSANPARREALVRSFIERQGAAGGFPIVSDSGFAAFVFIGSGTERDVRLVGDFDSRDFHDIAWDREGIPMERMAPDGSLFLAALRVEPDARLDYQFLVDGTPVPDALNPRGIHSGAGLSEKASQLVMPAYRAPRELVPRAGVPQGTLVVVDAPWAVHRVTVYLPARYDHRGSYPVVYTADGAAWRDIIRLPTILDHLIADRAIPAVIAVMIDAPDDRSAFYSYNPGYLSYLRTVVAYVDHQYATRSSATGRVLIGTSAGGRAVLYAALELPSMFGRVALLSPALGRAFYYFEPYLTGRRRPHPALRVWLSAGTYEGAICQDTLALERYLRSVHLQTRTSYTHQGHSFGAWQHEAVNALRFTLSTTR
jgi:enterochelin esterase-like enzyme